MSEASFSEMLISREGKVRLGTSVGILYVELVIMYFRICVPEWSKPLWKQLGMYRIDFLLDRVTFCIQILESHIPRKPPSPLDYNPLCPNGLSKRRLAPQIPVERIACQVATFTLAWESDMFNQTVLWSLHKLLSSAVHWKQNKLPVAVGNSFRVWLELPNSARFRTVGNQINAWK